MVGSFAGPGWQIFRSSTFPGEDFGRRLEREGPLPAAELRSMALQLARAQEAIRSGGVLHRDLKPAKVLLDTQGRVRGTDFGVA